MTTRTEIYVGVDLVDLTGETAKLMQRAPVHRMRDPYRLYVHHSGADGRKGYDGGIAAAKFFIRVREMSMPPYHFWIPRDPEIEGRIEIYQMAPVNWRCYHTGGHANTHGVGLAVQGNLSKRKLSHHQEEAMEAAVPYIEEHILNRDLLPDDEPWLSWHAEADRFGGKAKAACPGSHLRGWLREYRDACGDPKNPTYEPYER